MTIHPTKKYPTIVILGTIAKGGIDTVIRSHMESDLNESYDFVRIASHDDGSLSKRIGVMVVALFRLIFTLASINVVGLHLHCSMRGSFWRKSVFLFVCKCFRVPVILHMHGSETQAFLDGLGYFQRGVARAVLRNADRVVVLSESWRRYMDRYCPHSRLEVLTNFVHCERPSVPIQRGDDECFVLSFLGLVGERKGVYDLVHALSIVRQHISFPFKLLIAGNGDLHRLQNEIETAGVKPYVEVLGWISPSERAALLARSHLVVLPSYNEGLPMVLLEAMAAGVAVVSTHIGGIPDLIRNGVDGLLVEPGDVRALSQAIAQLMNNEGFRRQTAMVGSKRVADSFSAKPSLAALRALYSKTFHISCT